MSGGGEAFRDEIETYFADLKAARPPDAVDFAHRRWQGQLRPRRNNVMTAVDP
jgi:hypothetical protein